MLTAIPPRPLAAQEGAGTRTAGEGLPVVERTLDNGLRLLVLRREGPPTVSFVMQFQVGSVNEALGYTGTAHVLEHMLFKGTTTVGTRDFEREAALFPVIDAVADSILRSRAGRQAVDSARAEALLGRLRALEDSARTFVVSNEFDEILSRNGARGLNASTGYEATTYYVQLPANRAELWFALEADRMAHPVFREFYTERDVVLEERRRSIESDPGGLLYEALLAAAFRVHPYGVPVIGHASDLEALRREQVLEYYRRYYGPNNAVVAVVGDVQPDSVLAWAERHLGSLAGGEEPPPVLAVEPEQRGERRVEVVFDAEPAVQIGWRTVSALQPDDAPLSILGALLAGGRTSRLYRRMVLEDRIASGVFAGGGPGERHPGLFIISGTPRSPHTTTDFESAVYDELDRLREEPPAEVEMQRVRNQVEAANWQRLASSFGLAFQLAESETLFGDWRETFRRLDALRAVDPEDIQRVVAKYFTRTRRTVATLVAEEGR